MSILEKIRTKSGLLVGIIAIALLIFILESALDSGNRFFSGNKTRVGEIGGKDISISDFEAKVDEAAENEKARSGKTTIDDNTRENLRGQVWNQLLMETIMGQQYKELGLAVSETELFDMVQGKNPHPSVKQAFTNPQTGVFDPGQVITFLKNMDKPGNEDTKMRWINFEQAIKQERMATKFNTLLKKGLYVTKAEVKRDFMAKNRTIKFNYVVQRYTSVPDSTIKLAEDDLKKYYNENKNKFKQDFDSRDLDYVAFEVIPSAEDRNEAMQSLLKIAPEFAKATNDSDFVNQNADSKFEAQYAGRKSLAPQLDTLYNAGIGTIIGPYFDGNAFRLAKLTGVRMAPDSVKARHILLKVEGVSVEKVKAKADSLKKLIKAGAKFEDLAKANSTDPGSAAKGGDLGFFKEGMMVKPFNDACFNGKIGDMPIVESQFGVHLIEITGRGAETRKVLITYVDRQLKASTKTYQEAYQKATRFAGESRNLEQFESNVKSQKLTSMPAQMVRELDRNMGGLENSRLVVKWAYKANKGDVSEVFDLGSKFVVAVLKEVKEKGILPLEAVRKQVEFEAIRDKKAERFLADLDGKMKRAGSLSALAAEMKVVVDTAKTTSFAAPYLPSGRELGLVGMLSVAKTQSLLKPFKGENGVYVAQIWETTSPTFPSDWKDATDQLSNSLKSRVDYEAFEALKEKADIKDNRANFY